MRYSLRDLFWLAIVVALVTTWWLEHRPLAEECNRLRARPFWRFLNNVGPSNRVPSQSEQLRLQAVARLATMSDAELSTQLEGLLEKEFQHTSGHEPCLAEMAKRHKVAELRKQFESVKSRRPVGGIWRFPRDLELLTALRRAENLPDPLRINVAFEDDYEPWIPTLRATLENVDVKQESFMLTRGGDDRSGRRERWYFVLTDEEGKRVANADFFSIMGGGLSSLEPLKLGEIDAGYRFRLNGYLKRPKPGKYTLQVYYHNEQTIAAEQDLSGLIISKSRPITVQISTPPVPLRETFAHWLPIIVATFATGMLAIGSFQRWIMAKDGRPPRFRRRDLAWSLLVIMLGVGWTCDSNLYRGLIQNLSIDAEAKWRIERLED